MKIAFVGWTNPEDDLNILLECYQILKPLKLTSYDFINLNNGRDFLKENKRYDIVVLIYIFLLSREEIINAAPHAINDPLTKVSELHTKKNWRQRLLDTEAREILIFGLFEDSEISGRYIGELDNYRYSEIELTSSKGIYGKVWRYSKQGYLFEKDTNYDREAINYRDQADEL